MTDSINHADLHREVEESQLTRQEWLEVVADVQHEI